MMQSIEFLLSIYARGGGGGSSSGSGAGGILLLPVILIAAFVGWRRRKKRIKQAKLLQTTAASVDSTWSDATIQETVKQTFMSFQTDWSSFNVKNMKSYLTARYQAHMNLVLFVLQQMQRRNDMSRIELSAVQLMHVDDKVDNEEDRFSVEIRARATDSLIDTAQNTLLYTDKNPFTEMWHFDRENGQWKLDGISQADFFSDNNASFAVFAARRHLETSNANANKSMEFAMKNNFFYNADFGWLLMPNQGILFSNTNFKTSDINHHVIGMYKSVVVQFFEYVPFSPTQKHSILKQIQRFFYYGESVPHYIIAAAMLPKAYGNIVVRRKRTLVSLKPKNLHRVSTESMDFNKSYEVYASSVEQATSLELLHPVYIERLSQLPYKVNIEIVGSTLYLYTTDKKTDFQSMLGLLEEAFQEMKM